MKNELNITDYVVQDLMEGEYDKSILHIPLFPVNMRLFHTSPQFHSLIMQVIAYMKFKLQNKFAGYSQPRGISGANLGIPWNIIGYRINSKIHFMINPVVKNRSVETEMRSSNCGSVRLKDNIFVERHIWVDVEYYDVEGVLHMDRFYGADGGYTIQHEIENNLGILITDKNKEN